MAITDMTMIHERLVKLESSDIYQSKKLNEIHTALIGNGQPGIVAEWNQWKGGVRFFGIAVGVFLSVLSVCVGVLAYIK